MAYNLVLYEAEDGNKYLGRVSDDIFAIANNPASIGVASSSVKYRIGKTNRQFGVRPRIAVCTREVAVPGQNRSIIYTLKVPVFTKSSWASSAWQLNASVLYKNDTWTVTTRQPEDY